MSSRSGLRRIQHQVVEKVALGIPVGRGRGPKILDQVQPQKLARLGPLPARRAINLRIQRVFLRNQTKWVPVTASRMLPLNALLVLLVGAGCAGRTSVFEIVAYRASGHPKRYRETFDEAYYDRDAAGNVEIVLRRREPSETNPRTDVTQVIHLRTVWRSIPGETVAERPQINGTVSYAVVSGRVGTTFEGAGSIFFRENKRRDALRGSLDLALLKPKRHLSEGSAIFKHAELSGRFHAVRDPRRVARITNDLNRLCAPPPPPP